jgi:hypothetical protein
MYERDQETYDRPQRSYRSDRESESKLERIKREVKSWFDDDDDDYSRDYRDRNTDDYTTERSRRRQNYYSGDSRPSQSYRSSSSGSANWPNYRQHGYSRDNETGYRSGSGDWHNDDSDSERYRDSSGDAYSRDDRQSSRRSAAQQSEPEYVRHGNDYYLRDRGAGYGLTSSGPVRYAYASYWRVPGPHAGTGPKGYKRSSEGLKEQVCERLENDGRINASEIEVEVEDCEVTLKGKVPSREQKRCAEDCAESVHGIKDVHNRLSIDRNLETQSGDRSGYRDSVSTGDNSRSGNAGTQGGNAGTQGSKTDRTAKK